MGDSSSELNDSAAIELTWKIMVVGMAVLLLVAVFVLVLHLYAKWFWYRREEEEVAAAPTTTNPTRRRRRFDFAPGNLESAAASGLRRGLDPSLLKSLPLLAFNPKDFKDGLECAVCLSELADGDKTRLLPKCNHGFHVDCIDMWFQSHSTCPLCRNPVSTQSSAAPELTRETILDSPRTENSEVGGYSTESPNFPTNVLFWGNQTQISTLGSCLDEDRQGSISSQPHCYSSSSSSPPPSRSWSSSSSTVNRPEGMLVVDIPSQIGEDEELKSPLTTRMRTTKQRRRKLVRTIEWHRKETMLSNDYDLQFLRRRPKVSTVWSSICKRPETWFPIDWKFGRGILLYKLIDIRLLCLIGWDNPSSKLQKMY
ncbi:RING-type E3 ubiquitin transferase [Sarracenia purpurea var. burkii]